MRRQGGRGGKLERRRGGGGSVPCRGDFIVGHADYMLVPDVLSAARGTALEQGLRAATRAPYTLKMKKKTFRVPKGRTAPVTYARQNHSFVR